MAQGCSVSVRPWRRALARVLINFSLTPLESAECCAGSRSFSSDFQTCHANHSAKLTFVMWMTDNPVHSTGIDDTLGQANTTNRCFAHSREST
jgi:hypothetical protein